MGRPSKLNEETIERMSSEIRKGLPIKYACDLIGITNDCHNKWMRQGESDAEAESETLHAAYFSEVKKAYAEFVRHAGAIVRAGKAGWQGMAWWLERTNRDFMAKQQIQADDDGKVTVVIGGKPMPAKAVAAAKPTEPAGGEA